MTDMMKVGNNWVIALDEYERSNILWLLGLIGYSTIDPFLPVTRAVEPFTFCNNGDWVGQLFNKLSYENCNPPGRIPNGVTNGMALRVDEWIKSKIRAMSLQELIEVRKMNAHDISELESETHKEKQ